MLYTKTNPTGIDVPIQKAQKLLHDRLNDLWCADLDAYGRAYVLDRGDITIPEVFVDGKDYKDVLGYDCNRLFFVQDDIVTKVSNKWYETNVAIYFILNLKEIKPTVTHRADEESHNDVDYILHRTDFNVISIETGIDNVLSDFSISNRDNFNYADFEPYHVFKFNCNIKYDLSTTKCNV